MTLIDNGDGTWTDTDTGNKYDQGTGQIVNAVPDNTAQDYFNTPAQDPATGLVDTTAGQPVVNASPTVGNPATGGAQPATSSDGVANWLSTIESGFTNLYVPLAQAGVITTPAAANAAQLAKANQAAVVQAQQATSTNQRYLVIGGIILLGLLIYKSR